MKLQSPNSTIISQASRNPARVTSAGPQQESPDRVEMSRSQESGLKWGRIATAALIGAGAGALGAGAGAAASRHFNLSPVLTGAAGIGAAGAASGFVEGARKTVNSTEGALLIFAGIIFPPALLLVAAEPVGAAVVGSVLGGAAGAGLSALGLSGGAMTAVGAAAGAIVNGGLELLDQKKHG